MRDLEHQHQKALVTWAGYAAGADPRLRLLYAIPNGGLRSKAVAGKLKSEGVRSGVPDLCLPVAVRELHGLYLEMKAERGRVSAEQREWLEALAAAGYAACVTHGWDTARAAISIYLSGAWPSNEVETFKEVLR
jgi:hypothetical protein